MRTFLPKQKTGSVFLTLTAAVTLYGCGSRSVHLVDDFPLENAQGSLAAVVEIPAGTSEKWEVDPNSGALVWDERNGVPRVIDYLAYPGNYGFLPQTLLAEAAGGDGDALDVLIVGPARPRGTVLEVCVAGALRLLDEGEEDHKLIAYESTECGAGLVDFDERYPNARAIIEMWFTSYDSIDETVSLGWMNRDEAIDLIRSAHEAWREGRDGQDE